MTYKYTSTVASMLFNNASTFSYMQNVGPTGNKYNSNISLNGKSVGGMHWRAHFKFEMAFSVT